MIFHCTVFNKETGEIVQYSYFDCPEDSEFIDKNYQTRVGFFGSNTHSFIAEKPNNESQYVVMMEERPILVDRPSIPYQFDRTTLTAGTGDFITITGLHNPCELVIDDPDPTVETWRVTVDDGGFEFEADTPGVYTIEITHFPFIPAKIEIIASWP